MPRVTVSLCHSYQNRRDQARTLLIEKLSIVRHMANYKAKVMVNRKRYPPAYYRYRENNPTISIVLTKELKNFLDNQKRDTDMFYSQLVKKLINQAYDLDQARSEGRKEGHIRALREGEKKFKKEREKLRTISLGKCICGQAIVFHVDNPEELSPLDQAIPDSYLIHKGCPPKPFIFRLPDGQIKIG